MDVRWINAGGLDVVPVPDAQSGASVHGFAALFEG